MKESGNSSEDNSDQETEQVHSSTGRSAKRSVPAHKFKAPAVKTNGRAVEIVGKSKAIKKANK